ncbi:MAG TPA: hypothetical protein VKB54_09250 [Solirubrobacteraceae bacterium]|nr:hypothetical protein [Solirubrobacteraceae bacterium]
MASTDPSSGDEREVLAGLPNSRPQRRSAKRDQAAAKPKRAATPRASATRKAPEKAAPRKVPAAGYATPTEATSDAPKGADLFTTTIRAIGELAQIGVSASGRAVKSALHRLPRP